MIRTFAKNITSTLLSLKLKANFAQDWSHIYDGIYRF